MFCIKKCKDTQCKYHLPPKLNEELFDSLHHFPDRMHSSFRYKLFSDVYGSETTEKHRPSLSAARSSASSHRMPFNPSKQTALNVNVSAD